MSILEPRSIHVRGRQVQIRSARVDDAAELLDLFIEAASTSDYLGIGPEEIERNVVAEELRIGEFIDNPGWLSPVAVVDGRIAGRITFRNHPKQRLAHVGQLGMHVHSAWRGQGLGRALLAAFLEWAREHPTLEIATLGVMAPNGPAIALYESMGFRREQFRLRQFKLAPGRYCDDIRMYLPVKPLTGEVEAGVQISVDLHAPPAGALAMWKRREPFGGRRERRLADGAPIAIRRPVVADAEALIEQARGVKRTSAYNATTLEEFEQHFTPAREQEWIGEMARPGRLALLAEHRGEIIGALAFQPERRRRMAHWGHFGIGVSHGWRGRGVGRALIECLMDWAADEPGIEKVCLGVMAPNAGAYRLYRSMGFADEGMNVRGCRFGPGRYCDGIEMYQFVKPL